MDFYIKRIHQRIQTTRSHTSHCHHCHYCHYCNVNFVLLHTVKHYTKSPLSCIHVNMANLLNIMCTLVAAGMILGRLECNTRPSEACAHWEQCTNNIANQKSRIPQMAEIMWAMDVTHLLKNQLRVMHPSSIFPIGWKINQIAYYIDYYMHHHFFLTTAWQIEN